MMMQPEKPRVFFLGWDAEIDRIMTAHLTGSHAVQALLVPKGLKKLGHFMRRWSGGNRWLATRFLKQHGATCADILLATLYSAHKRLNPYVIERFQGTKILVMRDIVKNESAFAGLRRLFDRVYSFDPEQCARFHLDFLPQCIPFGQTALIQLRARSGCVPVPQTQQPFALYVGHADQRYTVLSAMAEHLRARGCKPDFFIVNAEGAKAGKPWCVADYIPYTDYIERALRAEVIVEANLPGQSGITLRTLEAAFLNKKLLTNNPFVRQLDFYDANNIFIFGEDDPCTLDRFLRGDVVPVEMDRLLPHTPEAMLEKIMADCELLNTDSRFS